MVFGVATLKLGLTPGTLPATAASAFLGAEAAAVLFATAARPCAAVPAVLLRSSNSTGAVRNGTGARLVAAEGVNGAPVLAAGAACLVEGAGWAGGTGAAAAVALAALVVAVALADVPAEFLVLAALVVVLLSERQGTACIAAGPG